MATIHLWVNASQAFHFKFAITAKFPQWPLARLDQSPLLMQAVVKAVGSRWNQALSFWDEAIHAWHDTLVSYPHRYRSRTIVVRLQNITLPISVIPSSMQAPAMQWAEEFRSTAALPPIYDMPVTSTPASSQISLPESTVAVPEGVHPASESNLSSQATAFADSDVASMPSTAIKPSQEPGSALLFQPSEQIELPLSPISEQDLNDEGTSSSNKLQKRWPGANVLVSTLLQWHQESVEGNITQKWLACWGGQWVFQSATVYRYRSWIDKVTYPRFFAKYGSQRDATVGDARIFYKKEFNQVASVKSKGKVVQLW
ncbi:uncharacterized protein MELLADRAFT_89085 [Melampsora larici-populina 98AG31]|uniref:Uncharacterized protein n=1 Tax=Melampsora larici-populina (strain 98AG31 / pathotype 3-4-7) TaxID=747676 RepID=F4R6Y5_MELLP|nr:uncharacterized protein MELLADRAFT_89085 [Melampsora larici-populina 98AG31]EGG12375.1 hypothetical protein MELLADRAFT_89085 [Melampsora larici-populina 98AG31]